MLDDLAPWDLLALFSTPTVTTVNSGAGTAQLVPANGRRWGFIVSVPGSPVGAVTMLPQGPTAPSGTVGILVTAAPQTHWVTPAKWGPLPTYEWTCFTSNISVTVIQLTLLQWPDDTSRKIVLPWEDDDKRLREQLTAGRKRQAAQLRRILESCESLSPRWQTNGN